MWLLEARKDIEQVLPLESPEGTIPARHLEVTPLRLILDFCPPELYKDKCVFF